MFRTRSGATDRVRDFQPDSGRLARGMADQDGEYEHTFIPQNEGTKVGPNRVEVAFSGFAEIVALLRAIQLGYLPTTWFHPRP